MREAVRVADHLSADEIKMRLQVSRSPHAGGAARPSGRLPGRGPFLQGLAGGLAGGMIANLLVSGSGHASPDGLAGGALGFFEIVLSCCFCTWHTGFSGSAGHGILLFRTTKRMKDQAGRVPFRSILKRGVRPIPPQLQPP